jgi:hypothetical protein
VLPACASEESDRVMDLDAFRVPGSRMQGASTTAMPCASSRMTQRSRRSAAAETLRGAAGCVAYPRCRSLPACRRQGRIALDTPSALRLDPLASGWRRDRAHYSVRLLATYRMIRLRGRLRAPCIWAPLRYSDFLLYPAPSLRDPVGKGAPLGRVWEISFDFGIARPFWV